jgi:hypothetical protein
VRLSIDIVDYLRPRSDAQTIQPSDWPSDSRQGRVAGPRALYNGAVFEPASPSHLAVLAADTTAAIEQRQVDAWRRLSPLQRLRLVSDTTRAVTNLSLAGIRRRYPAASERECFLRLAAILLGVDTARRVYPDAGALSDLRRPSCEIVPRASQ